MAYVLMPWEGQLEAIQGETARQFRVRAVWRRVRLDGWRGTD